MTNIQQLSRLARVERVANLLSRYFTIVETYKIQTYVSTSVLTVTMFSLVQTKNFDIAYFLYKIVLTFLICDYFRSVSALFYFLSH